ncbi:MAG: VOC family protein [Candidatus Binataceae bacterium]
MRPRQLGYIAMDVVDLDVSVRFYQDVAHLEISEERGGWVYMTGGREHHWLALRRKGTRGFNRVAFEMKNPHELEAMEKKLRAAGIEVERASALSSERVDQYIRFRDPEGTTVELFADMVTLPAPPSYAHRVHMDKLLHAVFLVTDVRRTFSFYSQLLGFRASDWVERSAVFMRCADRYHHSLALFSSSRPAFDHFCILVPALEDVMRARANALEMEIPMRSDILRHSPSGSIGTYIRDEANDHAVEFCCNHARVEDDDDHQPRVLRRMPNVWDAAGPSYQIRDGARPRKTANVSVTVATPDERLSEP